MRELQREKQHLAALKADKDRVRMRIFILRGMDRDTQHLEYEHRILSMMIEQREGPTEPTTAESTNDLIIMGAIVFLSVLFGMLFNVCRLIHVCILVVLL